MYFVPPPQINTVQTKQFVWALFLSPITVAVVGCWIVLIPVYALVLGIIPYLIFGTPLLLRVVRTGPLKVSRFLIASVIGQVQLVLGLGVLYLILNITGVTPDTGYDGTLVFIGFLAIAGFIFAPLWAAVFCLYYRNFTTDFPTEKGDC